MAAIPGHPTFIAGAQAGTTLAGHQFKGMIMNASGDYLIPTTTSVIGLFRGVLMNKPAAAGDAASIIAAGPAKMKTSTTTLSAGDIIACSTAGWAIPPSTDAGAIGYVAKGGTSGSTGRVLPVFLTGSLGLEGIS